jgi:hypothetical protein
MDILDLMKIQIGYLLALGCKKQIDQTEINKNNTHTPAQTNNFPTNAKLFFR